MRFQKNCHSCQRRHRTMTPDEISGVAAPVEKVERTITVQGIETHLFEAGPTSTPALLYLHGTFLGNLWLEFHQVLSQRFHLRARYPRLRFDRSTRLDARHE